MNRGWPGPRNRPHWWPSDEPWPPNGPPGRGWQGRPPLHFMWRVGLALLLFPLLLFTAFAIIFWLAAAAIGAIDVPRSAFVWVIPLGILALVFGFASIVRLARSLRVSAAPITELLGAAEKVANGDLSARVSEAGPRELRQLAHAFNLMSARLEATDQQRRDFLADVTHELRTPLTVVTGNLEGMLDGVYAADLQRLNATLEETRLLATLVEDLRTLALAETGSLPLQIEPIDMAVLAAETVVQFRRQAEDRGVTLESEATPGLGTVEVDPVCIRQVLENLIANALNYSKAGDSVRVRCAANPAGPGIQLVVKDSGIGIAPEDLPRVFDRFWKGSRSTGSGLGLAIVRDLVNAHGGTVAITSLSGQGTEVAVTLP
ncbi:MAG: HAMP domain-containing histidine kinase [Chloroflexi bacterium]|nr:HAMP domain-containing histidine kinase [Chloroflexota bacterium]